MEIARSWTGWAGDWRCEMRDWYHGLRMPLNLALVLDPAGGRCCAEPKVQKLVSRWCLLVVGCVCVCLWYSHLRQKVQTFASRRGLGIGMMDPQCPQRRPSASTYTGTAVLQYVLSPFRQRPVTPQTSPPPSPSPNSHYCIITYITQPCRVTLDKSTLPPCPPRRLPCARHSQPWAAPAAANTTTYRRY